MAPFATFLWYSLWFLVAFSVTVLWAVAVSDIRSQMRKGLVTTARSLFMVVAVSVVAAGAVAAAGAVIPHGWIGAMPKRPFDASVAKPEPGCQNLTFTYSFGVEQPAHASRQCAANPS
jgi:hypothetical protein